MAEELTSQLLIEALNQDLPQETCDLLVKRPSDLNIEELQLYGERVLPYRHFIVKSLERAYLDSGQKPIWEELAGSTREKSIIESYASEAVEAAAGGVVARVETGGISAHESAGNEATSTDADAASVDGGETIILGAGASEADDRGATLVEHAPSPAPDTALVDIEKVTNDGGTQVEGASWCRRNLKWLIIGASALLMLALAALTTVLLMLGREKTVYAWSRSERIGNDVRLERRIVQRKNSGGSPYLLTVNISVTNQGEGNIEVLELEEDVPSILSRREGLSFGIEPERRKDDLDVVGWSIRGLGAGDVYELDYSLPLQMELSKPQLQEMEEQFSLLIVAFVRMPENKVTCSACSGSGNNPCGNCLTMGSVACPGCGGAGTFSCSSCGGKGTGTCAYCGGSGRYYYCYGCRRNLTSSQYFNNYFCPYCGAEPKYQKGPYACSTCSGTGTSKCGSCGGSGRIKCGTCGGGARVVCDACGGAGQVVCPGCDGGGRVPYTFGWGELY